jgi:hypothetical protein
LTLAPSIGFCDNARSSPCVNALEQIATLKTRVPVYKQVPGDQRNYFKDSDRPAELARIRAVGHERLQQGFCGQGQPAGRG